MNFTIDRDNFEVIAIKNGITLITRIKDKRCVLFYKDDNYNLKKFASLPSPKILKEVMEQSLITEEQADELEAFLDPFFDTALSMLENQKSRLNSEKIIEQSDLIGDAIDNYDYHSDFTWDKVFEDGFKEGYFSAMKTKEPQLKTYFVIYSTRSEEGDFFTKKEFIKLEEWNEAEAVKRLNFDCEFIGFESISLL
ncbi:MAG: hypothetical protein HUJ68_03460 [Clostridia bacterium]|nr:hypothetical protein [Clostridia bacterium]